MAVSENSQVLIVGSGPAGSTLALYLAQQNIEVTLVEKESSIPLDIRASTFHPPSLEMLDKLGVSEELIEMGLITSHYQYRDRSTGEMAVFDMGVLKNETKYPFRLQCEQYKYTQLVNKKLQEYDNVNVLLGHQLTGFHQNTDGIRALIKPRTMKRLFRRLTL